MDHGLQILGVEQSFQNVTLAEHPVEPSGESGKVRGGEVAGCRQIYVRVPIDNVWQHSINKNPGDRTRIYIEGLRRRAHCPDQFPLKMEP